MKNETSNDKAKTALTKSAIYIALLFICGQSVVLINAVLTMRGYLDAWEVSGLSLIGCLAVVLFFGFFVEGIRQGILATYYGTKEEKPGRRQVICKGSSQEERAGADLVEHFRGQPTPTREELHEACRERGLDVKLGESLVCFSIQF